MHKLFKKTKRPVLNTNHLNLSNNIRIILYLWLLIIFVIPLIGYSQNAYINDFRVNDDATTRSQSASRIGVDSAGNFVIAWNDRRNFPGFWTQVFYQNLDKNGTRIGNNFRIWQDTTGLLCLTVLRDGKFIVSWVNIINGGFNAQIYFQRFDKVGNPIQQPVLVVDSVFSRVKKMVLLK